MKRVSKAKKNSKERLVIAGGARGKYYPKEKLDEIEKRNAEIHLVHKELMDGFHLRLPREAQSG